jgi:hypothetical protein
LASAAALASGVCGRGSGGGEVDREKCAA